MNLTWHIAKKDLQRFSAPLALLCVVSLIRFGIGISLLTTNDPWPEWFGHMAIYSNVLWGIGLFLTYMLAAAVVQEDSVASPAFWRTRPISGTRLLASKAIGLFLMFGLLPVLITIPWWLGCGFGWSEIWRAAVETLAIQSGVVLLALPWAVVTGQYDRFLLWTVVAAVAGITGFIILVAERGMISKPEASTTWAGPTCVLVIGLLAATGCLATAIHQFVTRKTGRSVIFIVVTALSIAAVGKWWTWDAPAIWSLMPVAPSGLAKDIKISPDYIYVSATTNANGAAQFTMLAESVPPHCGLSPLYSEQNLRWTDGSVTTQMQFNMWGNQMLSAEGQVQDLLHLIPETQDQDWVQYRMRRYLEPRHPWESKERNKSYAGSFAMALSPEAMRKLADQKPIYDGVFWFRLLQGELIGEKGIQVGSDFERGPSRSRIAALYKDLEKKILWISIIESEPESLWMDFLRNTELTGPRSQPAYCAVNRKQTYARELFGETSDRAIISNVAIVLRKGVFRGQNHWNASTHTWESEVNGFEGATLAEVRFREVGRFSLPLEVGHLALEPTHAHPRGASIPLTFTVTGEVTKAGTFSFFPGFNLVNALREARGVSDRADLSKVTLTHMTADGVSSTVVVNVEAWLEATTPSKSAIPVLEPGDVVNVPAMDAGQTPQP